MQQNNKALMAVLFMALFSLTALQGFNVFLRQQQVLGVRTDQLAMLSIAPSSYPTKSTTPRPPTSTPTTVTPTIVKGSIPCSQIMYLQQLYCSTPPSPPVPTTIKTTPFPTGIRITPTIPKP